MNIYMMPAHMHVYIMFISYILVTGSAFLYIIIILVMIIAVCNTSEIEM